MAVNLTFEQKEKNKQYILDHLDKYTIDNNGNFFNVDPEILGKEYDYINQNALTSKAVEEIKKKITETIIEKKRNWELVLSDTDDPYPRFFKNKKSGLIIKYRPLGYSNYRFLIGEFGYRGHIWKDYEKWKKDKEEREKKQKKNSNYLSQTETQTHNQTPTPQQSNPETEKENLNQFQNPKTTPQQKEEALNNLQKNEGEPTYEEQKENINQVKTEQATQNPTEYSQNAVNKIEQKMQEEGISEKDLKDNQTKELFTNLKNGQIKDPTKIVAVETEIRQKVWQTKVEKEIQTLTLEVNQLLSTGKKIKKENITKLKQKLIEFLAKSNVYYSSQHQKVQALLNKLESYSNTSQQNNSLSSPSSVPWKVIVLILVIAAIALMAVVIRIKKGAIRKKNKK